LYELVGFSTLLYVRIILVFITLLIAFSIEE
jgi:hypothetical protein